MSAALDQIKAEVTTLRTTQTEIADAITALAGRLTDNPTDAEVAAVAAELGEVVAGFQDFNESLDSLDPAVPGGAVEEEPEA